jgi:hypothetical protein
LAFTRLCVRVVALAASLSLGGCSFIFSEGPPAQHRRLPYFDCSSSYAPPVLDTIWGALNGLAAVSVLGRSEEAWKRDQTTSRSSVIAVGLIWLAVSGSSAIYGYSKVGACREAKDELILRYARPPGPRAWPPPPPADPSPPVPAPPPSP